MLKLNLLPLTEKRRLELKELQMRINLLFLWLAAVLVAFISLLAATYFILHILIQAQQDLITERRADQKTQEVSFMGERIERLNQELKIIGDKQNSAIVWTPLLIELSNIIPEGVYLTNLNYQKTNGELHIVGYARTRDNLLAFENQLKQSGYFSGLESPLSNVIRQMDINFNFTLKPVSYSLVE